LRLSLLILRFNQKKPEVRTELLSCGALRDNPLVETIKTVISKSLFFNLIIEYFRDQFSSKLARNDEVKIGETNQGYIRLVN